VAHVRLAAPLELLEQEVVDGAERPLERAVESLVADVQDPATVHPETAAEGDPVRRYRRGRVERARRRSLPVHDEDSLALVVHPPAADVERVFGALDVEPPEAEPPLRILERPQAPDDPLVE